jgi:hypothetical protein
VKISDRRNSKRDLLVRNTLAAMVLLGAVVALGLLSGSARVAKAASGPVAGGLDNPRGLTFLPDGSLLVAEAGHGGDVCVAYPAAPSGKDCIGTSSQVSKVDLSSGAHTPVVSGLFSDSSLGVVGIDGISVQGGRLPGKTTGKLFGVMGEFPQGLADWTCNGQPADCSAVLAAGRAQAGQLIEFTTTGSWKAVAGVGSYDYDWTRTNHALSPEVDANPYGLLPLVKGTWVADAASNTLDWVPANGSIIIASGIPAPGPGFPIDGVPTCVTMVRGNLYAADLAGRFWKRNGKFDPSQIPVADGSGKSLIHHVTGCTADSTGNFYLVDMWGVPGPPIPAGPKSVANTGSVIKLAKDGTATVLASGLNFPNGIALAADGSLYVSIGSTCPATGSPFPYCAQGGQIIRIPKS